jgi:hypothetical protein
VTAERDDGIAMHTASQHIHKWRYLPTAVDRHTYPHVPKKSLLHSLGGICRFQALGFSINTQKVSFYSCRLGEQGLTVGQAFTDVRPLTTLQDKLGIEGIQARQQAHGERVVQVRRQGLGANKQQELRRV